MTMTAKEWMNCESPAQMLAQLGLSDRAARLLSIAIVRVSERGEPDLATRRGTKEVAEAMADGGLLPRESAMARYEGAWLLSSDPMQVMRDIAYTYCNADHAYCHHDQCNAIRDIVGNPFDPDLHLWVECDLCHGSGKASFTPLAIQCRRCDGKGRIPGPLITPDVISLAQAAYDERRRLCEKCKGAKSVPHCSGMYRIGNDPCPVCRSDGCVDDGTLDPVRLTILADALEDAGFEDASALNHLRGVEKCWACLGEGGWQANSTWVPCEICEGEEWMPLRGPHYRGCWAVGAVLGKE